MTEKSGVSRRDLFQIIGSVPALAAATAGVGPAQTHEAHQSAYQRKVFDDHDWHTVRVLCDLIVPADERSGSATQAGVPEFIDDWLDFRKQEDGNDDLAAQILGGLAWLDHESSRLFNKAFAAADRSGTSNCSIALRGRSRPRRTTAAGPSSLVSSGI
jgi:gluconate 2-dehydrogenase gamma chain